MIVYNWLEYLAFSKENNLKSLLVIEGFLSGYKL